jgi:hypothetical protein
MSLFIKCLQEGYTTVDARDYAHLEVVGRPFHEAHNP